MGKLKPSGTWRTDTWTGPVGEHGHLLNSRQYRWWLQGTLPVTLEVLSDAGEVLSHSKISLEIDETFSAPITVKDSRKARDEKLADFVGASLTERLRKTLEGESLAQTRARWSSSRGEMPDIDLLRDPRIALLDALVPELLDLPELAALEEARDQVASVFELGLLDGLSEADPGTREILTTYRAALSALDRSAVLDTLRSVQKLVREAPAELEGRHFDGMVRSLGGRPLDLLDVAAFELVATAVDALLLWAAQAGEVETATFSPIPRDVEVVERALAELGEHLKREQSVAEWAAAARAKPS